MRIVNLSLVTLVFLLFGTATACASALDTTELQIQLDKILKEEGEVPYVKAIFRSHPQKEIQEDFLALIENGEVILRREYRSTGVPGAVTPQWNADGDMNLLFGLENEFFQWEVKRLWSILTHEWTHVKDIRAGITYIPSPNEKHTAQTVRSLFEDEARAYKEQCRFQKDIGITDDHPACPVFFEDGEREFRRGLANIMSKNPDLVGFTSILFDQAET